MLETLSLAVSRSIWVGIYTIWSKSSETKLIEERTRNKHIKGFSKILFSCRIARNFILLFCTFLIFPYFLDKLCTAFIIIQEKKGMSTSLLTYIPTRMPGLGMKETENISKSQERGEGKEI